VDFSALYGLLNTATLKRTRFSQSISSPSRKKMNKNLRANVFVSREYELITVFPILQSARLSAKSGADAGYGLSLDAERICLSHRHAVLVQTVQERADKLSMAGHGAWRDNLFVERLWKLVKYGISGNNAHPLSIKANGRKP